VARHGGRLLRRLEVHELAERVLREPRDSERRLFAVDARPVVFGVVPQVVGVGLSRHSAPLVSRSASSPRGRGGGGRAPRSSARFPPEPEERERIPSRYRARAWANGSPRSLRRPRRSASPAAESRAPP